MSDNPIWLLYVALWRAAQGAGVAVHYLGISVEGEAGFFDPHDEPEAQRGPQLAIVRPHFDAPDCGYEPSPARNDGQKVELLAELCVLAHEFGHIRSWQRGERTPAYAQALRTFNDRKQTGKHPNGEQCGLIKDEEERAWRYAEEELRSRNFTEWPLFQSAKETSLANYDALLLRSPSGAVSGAGGGS
jgi:hypothetical protein